MRQIVVKSTATERSVKYSGVLLPRVDPNLAKFSRRVTSLSENSLLTSTWLRVHQDGAFHS
ncbi:hypothetical protein LMG27952_04943 [Paraburkholderia hiiakae]|uniref:Uncharacterized protein n=1 Tax=Paraburkholderia hiiakae TaxID=1081782 RepID=A0ABM8NYV4_9BURK|nr:hypothetical protein LMG27952_04943 [Paraburkholderia hiiakae]